MLRSGLLLGMAGPAAVLTLLIHPIVRDGADVARSQNQRVVVIDGAGMPALAIQVSSVERSLTRSDERTVKPQTRSGPDKASSKPPRRLMKEGCEGAISSLAGPEARRMVPGRCIA